MGGASGPIGPPLAAGPVIASSDGPIKRELVRVWFSCSVYSLIINGKKFWTVRPHVHSFFSEYGNELSFECEYWLVRLILAVDETLKGSEGTDSTLFK